MRLILRNTFLLLIMLSSMQLLAQPANDDCGGALEVVVAEGEDAVVRIAGDTRGATPSSDATGSPNSVCSASWFSDDIWYTMVVSREVLPSEELVFKTYFDQDVNPDDIPEVGMGLYTSCAGDAEPVLCFSNSPGRNTLTLTGGVCVESGTTYYLRVWSAGAPFDFSGTLEVGAFIETVSTDIIVWEEDFSDGLAGWTTEGLGVCNFNLDSSANAVFRWFPNGVINQGSFTDAVVNSPTSCNGMAGVDSDYNDNLGAVIFDDAGNITNPEVFNTGPVPTSNDLLSDYQLVSPAIYTRDFDVSGLTLTFTFGLRAFNSTRYFASWRSKNTGDMAWGDWTDVEFSEEITANNADAGTERFFMPGTTDFDSLQVRFFYRANYYYFAVDDVRLIETEGHNMRAQSNFYATAPYAVVPATEVRPYHGLIDIYNVGALTQTGVKVNHTVIQDGSGSEVYNQDLAYEPIGPDSIAENKLFPDPVIIPNEVGSYSGTYTVSADSTDFDMSDNSQSYSFNLSSVEYAHETGRTRAVAVANGIYDDGAPLSYAYGNVFSFPNGSQYSLNSVNWGVTNPDEMAGFTVNIVLYDWIDANGDEIVAFDEREILGLADYTFIGDEGAGVILTSELENFENPGDPILFRDGGMYIAMIEYQANTANDPQFFLESSEAVDYGAITFAMDSAFIKGWVDYRTYISCLGFSSDGNISGIDYEVKELDVEDERVFFGNDIVPLVRLNVQVGVGTEDPLPTENLISIYPNPASELMNIKLEFEKPFEQVLLNIYDMKGQLILNKTLTNIQSQTESLDVRALSAGTYMLKVVTEDGQRTQRFVVQQ